MASGTLGLARAPGVLLLAASLCVASCGSSRGALPAGKDAGGGKDDLDAAGAASGDGASPAVSDAVGSMVRDAASESVAQGAKDAKDATGTVGRDGATPAGDAATQAVKDAGGPLSNDATGSSGGGGGAVICSGTQLEATEASNYRIWGSITLLPVTVAPHEDLYFDWSGVTSDLLGHPVDPKKDIHTVALLSWDLSLAEVENRLVHDAIEASDMMMVPLMYEVGEGEPTSAKLSNFTLSGTPVSSPQVAGLLADLFDPVKHPPEKSSYALMISTSHSFGLGAVTLQALTPDRASSNTEVKITSDSARLDFTADLTMLQPMGVPAGTASITLDWENLKRNARGDAFYAYSITRAMIGHYRESPAELSQRFRDLELMATEMYQFDIVDVSPVRFSDLADSVGNVFPGITADGTWLVGLFCDSIGCQNRAPSYLTILKPACQN